MHHLHPRSRTTSTLFTTTLAVSFLVVGLPHILPCPVDRRQFADSVEMPDGTIRRRRRRRSSEEEVESTAQAVVAETVQEDETGRRKRECPVPKPGGLVGQMMGFDQKGRDKPVEVVVKSLRSRNVESSSNDRNTVS